MGSSKKDRGSDKRGEGKSRHRHRDDSDDDDKASMLLLVFVASYSACFFLKPQIVVYYLTLHSISCIQRQAVVIETDQEKGTGHVKGISVFN